VGLDVISLTIVKYVSSVEEDVVWALVYSTGAGEVTVDVKLVIV
jgi:hypothetical protein